MPPSSRQPCRPKPGFHAVDAPVEPGRATVFLEGAASRLKAPGNFPKDAARDLGQERRVKAEELAVAILQQVLAPDAQFQRPGRTPGQAKVEPDVGGSG